MKAGCPGYTGDTRRMLAQNSTATTGTGTINEEDPKCSRSYFPLPFFLFFMGYVLILMVDRVIMRHSHGGHSHDEEGHIHKHDGSEIKEEKNKSKDSIKQDNQNSEDMKSM